MHNVLTPAKFNNLQIDETSVDSFSFSFVIRFKIWINGGRTTDCFVTYTDSLMTKTGTNFVIHKC